MNWLRRIFTREVERVLLLNGYAIGRKFSGWERAEPVADAPGNKSWEDWEAFRAAGGRIVTDVTAPNFGAIIPPGQDQPTAGKGVSDV